MLSLVDVLAFIDIYKALNEEAIPQSFEAAGGRIDVVARDDGNGQFSDGTGNGGMGNY